jgi:PAS domain S-box-containing protein
MNLASPIIWVIIISVLLIVIIILAVKLLMVIKAKNSSVYLTLFQKSFEPVLIIKEGKFIDLNESALNYLGFDNKKEVENMSPDEISPEFQDDGQNSRNKAERMIRMAKQYGHHHFEWQHISKTGEPLYVEVSLTVINIRGVEHIYTVWRDIKDKKDFEQELKLAKEKAEESDRLKSAFLESISHEIRTPMNAIIGFAQLLNHQENSPEEVKEFVDYINRSGNSLLLIIDNIIDVSSLRSGAFEIRTSKLKLNSLFEDIYSIFHFETSVKDVKLKMDNKVKDKDLTLIVDGSRLRKTLFQIVNNSIKFTEHGTVTFGCFKEGPYLQFFVSDTGVGIDKEELKNVFKVFTKATPKGEKLYSGTGLGLSIAKASVENMGGKIWIESELGKGTSVYFTIPYNIQRD